MSLEITEDDQMIIFSFFQTPTGMLNADLEQQLLLTLFKDHEVILKKNIMLKTMLQLKDDMIVRKKNEKRLKSLKQNKLKHLVSD